MIRDGRFRKAKDSERTGCVEVAALAGGGIAVRDSKRRAGGTLSVGDQQWRQFIRQIKTGRFGPPEAYQSTCRTSSYTGVSSHASSSWQSSGQKRRIALLP